MIIFLYGPDTYRSRQKLNEIIEHYQKIHKSGLNLKCFDFEENKASTELSRTSFEEFQDFIQTTSMFKEKKLVILKNAPPNLEIEKEILNLIKNPRYQNEIILFYEEKEIDNKRPLFQYLKKQGKSQEFKLLGGQKLRNWVKKEFEKYGANIENQALEKLIDFVGNDLWHLSNEIKKLVSFKGGERVEIKDVETLVKPKIETDIFETIDAIASKNKKQALELLHKHLEKGDSPLYLLSMINFQFRNLLEIKDLIERKKSYQQILNKIKLHPYVIQKSYWQAKKFSLQELKKIYQRIFQVDLSIKTGKIEPKTALDLLITEI